MHGEKFERMKKIIFFIDNLGSGGAQRQIVNTSIMLKNEGYAVSVLLYGDTPFYKHYLDDNNIPTILINPKGKLARLTQIRKYLRKSDADVVVAFLETPGFIACFSRMGGKVRWRLVTSERSAQENSFKSKKNKFFNWFERYSNAKVCNSENAKRLWEKYYPQYKEKYSVIYNPVLIPDEILNAEKDSTTTDKICLTVAASYQGLKNPLRVIEAVSQLTTEQKQRLRLQWFGKTVVANEGSSVYDRARELVKEYGLEECVILNEATKDIYQIMKDSTAVGLFSTVEGLPNTICEGMMLGKPIVMSKVSDYQILTDGNGILCEAESVESIKNALIELLNSSPERLKQMGEVSQEKAKKLFAQKQITQQWIQLVENI